MGAGAVPARWHVHEPEPDPDRDGEPDGDRADPSVAPSASLPAPISVTAEATVAVEQPIALVASADGDLWALAPGRLDRIDPDTDTVSGSVTLGSTTEQYNGLAANADGLWATNSDAAVVYRVDPTTLAVVAPITAGQAPKGVLATDAGVWVADVHGGSVLRIDPATNTVVATTTVGRTGASGPNWLADGFGTIWVDVPNNTTVARIAPATNTVQATIDAPRGLTPCGGIAVGDGRGMDHRLLVVTDDGPRRPDHGHFRGDGRPRRVRLHPDRDR